MLSTHSSYVFFIRTLFSLILLVGQLTASVFANNIQVTNVQRDTFNFTEQWAQVKFDISWENSWRTTVGPANWDAAWVFVKFKVGGSNPQLSNARSSGTTVTVSSTAKLRPGMPVRVMSGTGTLAANSVINSISNDSQFVLSATPTVDLSAATIECIRIWEHAYLDTIDARHIAPEGSTINAPNDSTGAFIYRNATGYGTFSLTGVRLRWKWGSNGIVPPNTDTVDIRVFAIEMVYVPQGSFYVGSGGTESGSFTDGSWTSGATIPYQITSETTLGIDNTVGKLWGNNVNDIGNAAADPEATIAAAYPKGYAAFYSMKYEITQGQYRDFLNSLNYIQQANRTAVVPTSAAGTSALNNSNRNGLKIQTPGNSTTLVSAVYGCNLDSDGTYNENVDGEWIPCGNLSWMDACAFMDWSGLRPMSELEFEKACRGNQAAVAGEYAWGTSTVHASSYASLSNSGAANELPNAPSTTAGNAVYITTGKVTGIQGPLRVGIFATSGSSRVTAGATYYGIMEMNGNLFERAVSVGLAAGRSFTGLHGDGNLFRDGSANVDFWPGINGNSSTTTANTTFGGAVGVTDAAGAGLRGGSWDSTVDKLRVSDRSGINTRSISRSPEFGARGVRSSP